MCDFDGHKDILLWEIFILGGNPYLSVPVEKLLRVGHHMD